MADRDTQRMIQEQRELNRISAEQLRILKDQNRALEEQVANSEKKAELEEKILDRTTKGMELTKALGKFDRQDLKSQAKKAKFSQLIRDAEAEAAILRKKAVRLSKSTNKDTQNIAKTLAAQAESIEESVVQAGKLKREFNNFNKATKGFERISGLVKEIPILRKAFSGFAEMSKAAGDAYIQTGSRGKAAMAGLGRGMKGGLQVLLASLIGGIVGGLGRTDKVATQLQRTLNLTRGSAEAFGKELSSISDGKAYVTFQELQDSAIGFSMAMQSGAAPTGETAEQAFILSNRLGVSVDQAGQLYRLSTVTGESFKDTTSSIVGQVMALSDANNISIKYADVLKDVGSAGAATLLTTQKFPGGIAKAAFEARKFGLSLGQLDKTSSSLLNFQSSIESELEAELLTGKRLNLEQARMAALMGDQATLASEIAKNVGTSAEFGSMNVIQQEALAKAFGMSREELAQSLVQREALLKLEKETGVAGLARMNTEERIAALMEDGKTRAEALKALGEQEMLSQYQAETAQKKFTNMLEGVGDSLGKLISALTGTDNPLAKLGDAVAKMNKLLSDFITRAETVGFTSALFGGGKEVSFSKQFESAKQAGKLTDEQLAELAKIQENTNKYAGSAKMATAGPMIAQGGFLARLYYDYMAQKEAEKGLSIIKNNGKETVNDFTLRTNPKDTLVMAGGTRFGEETNALLKELVTAVKEGGHVYIDGRKVGETLALNYTAIG